MRIYALLLSLLPSLALGQAAVPVPTFITASGRFSAHLLPVADATHDIGSPSGPTLRWQDLHLSRAISDGTVQRFRIFTPANIYRAREANVTGSAAHIFGNNVALTDAGAKLADFYSDEFATLKLSIMANGTIVPGAHQGTDIGSASLSFLNAYMASIRDPGGNVRISGMGIAVNNNSYISTQADTAGAYSHSFRVKNVLTNADSALAEFCNEAGGACVASKASIGKDGEYKMPTAGMTPAHRAATLFYCGGEDQTLCYYNENSNVTHNVGQESWIRVWNATGVTIANGAAVYINGRDITTELPTVALAKADARATAVVAGLMTHSCANATACYVTAFGVVRDITTDLMAVGQVAWLSSTTAGNLTTTRPASPALSVQVGVVTKQHATLGRILVAPQAPEDTGRSFRATASLDFASAAAGACSADLTITVTGAVIGAECIVGPPDVVPAGSTYTCRVSLADTAAVRHCCVAGVACDPAAATYSARVFNP